jgi:hypothetical protein
MELDEYFHNLNKEPKMNKDTKVHFCITEDNSDLEEFPDTHFEMTASYAGPQWIAIVEDVLKVLEASYGYPIRDKVYYSVANPIFDHNISPAPGRELNAEVLEYLTYSYRKLNNNGKHKPYADSSNS